MSSDLEQSEREEVMLAFRQQKLPILVATDVVSRGIDIDSIELVVNYDVPPNEEDYVHRIGRTARAERKGEGITLVTPDDMRRFGKIEKLIEKEVPKLKVPEALGDTPNYDPKSSGSRGGGRGGKPGGGGRHGGGRRHGGGHSGGGRGKGGQGKEARVEEKTSAEKGSPEAAVVAARVDHPKDHESDARRVEGQALRGGAPRDARERHGTPTHQRIQRGVARRHVSLQGMRHCAVRKPLQVQCRMRLAQF